MIFIARQGLPKGDITKGRVYEGTFVERSVGLRIVVWNNRFEWQTYNPKIFRPMDHPRNFLTGLEQLGLQPPPTR